MNIIRIIYRRTEQFISTSMCAQEVNIEEQCAEHFLLQNDRSADRVNRGDQFWLKNRTLETENICHNFLT